MINLQNDSEEVMIYRALMGKKRKKKILLGGGTNKSWVISTFLGNQR